MTFSIHVVSNILQLSIQRFSELSEMIVEFTEIW